jgi:NAD(P)-dependent dehydrogenase (short-subunit alcohol dehydrogenase family)
MTRSQRVLVAGGTSAIGTAIVETLRRQDAHVVFTGRNDERGKAIAERADATYLRAEARDLAQVRGSVHTALDVLGGLDALVLTTGVLHEGPLSHTPDAVWDELININLLANFAYATECLPALREAGGGAIVTVCSAAAVWPDISTGAYAVSKRALLMLSEMLSMEGARAGVRVNVVCPGDTADGMSAIVDGRPAVLPAAPLPRPPLGRFTKPSDVADAVTYFLSESASFCTGATLVVDGGMRAADRAWAVSGV